MTHEIAFARDIADHVLFMDAGTNNVQISLNRGVLPHEMFVEQVRRFSREVPPALQAHLIARVPLAE